MNKIYTFKHLLFALRKEYIEIEKQLDELKEYVDVSNKVQHFYFYILGNPCKIVLYLHKKKNLLEKIAMLLDQYIYGRTNYDVTKDLKSIYLYNKKELCYIKEQGELKKLIKQITETDFFKNIVADNLIPIHCIENQTNTLLITSGSINLFNDDSPSIFNYNSRYDEIIMENKEKTISSDDILKILNLSFDGSYLNDYHRNILDNYEEKEIEIVDNFDSKESKLEIIEETKKLILKQKSN